MLVFRRDGLTSIFRVSLKIMSRLLATWPVRIRLANRPEVIFFERSSVVDSDRTFARMEGMLRPFSDVKQESCASH